MRLARTNKTPIHGWSALHTHKTAAGAKPAECRGLRPFTGVTRDCPVLLLVNLWTAAGLVNGSVGTVRDVVYLPEAFEDP